MKIHLAWIQLTATAAIVAGAAQPAVAQYPPYRPLPAKPAAQPIATQPTAAYAPQVPYRQGSVQAPTQQYPVQQYPATQYPSTPIQPAIQAQSAIPPYQPAVAPYRPSTAAIPQYPQTSAPAPSNRGTYYVAQQVPPPVPPQGNANAAAATNAAAGNGSAAPATSAESYANGMYNNNANGYGCNGAGACASGCNGGCGDYASGCCDDCGYKSQWFGGVYFLLMERDNAHPLNVAALVPDAPPTTYPTPSSVVIVAGDYDFEPGVEVRFGSTFTIGDSCDNCSSGCGSYGYGYGGCNNNCTPCCKAPDVYAWEVGYWGLLENENESTFYEQPAYGLYGLQSFAGLGYDSDGDAAIDNPVNGYYGYAPPIGTTTVLTQRIRTNFQAQNLELNIMRFPVCNTGCGGCGNGCNSGCSTGCNTCGCDSGCDDGWACCYSAYGSCGVRYFRIDDDFFYATENGGTQGFTYDDPNELFYDVDVDNNLIGPQLGWTMNYAIGCKWNFFLNSTFGVFENHINSKQRMYTGGPGAVYFYDATGATGERFDLSNSKDDISFLGELRVGGSYDVTCNWRAVLAYRAVAATGLATSLGQVPANFANSTGVGIINSDDSMIVHGIQVGAECRY